MRVFLLAHSIASFSGLFLGKAPLYLSNCCITVSQVASRRHQLTIPRHLLSTYGQRAFAVAGPTMFNTLRDDL